MRLPRRKHVYQGVSAGLPFRVFRRTFILAGADTTVTDAAIAD